MNFDQTTYYVVEGDQVKLNVFLSAPTLHDVTIELVTKDGTARGI